MTNTNLLYSSFISEITGDQYSALSLQFLLGYLFAPLMWIIGVPAEDMALAGQLLGEKIIISEFIAYISLSQIQEAGHFAFQKSILMSTYMLCGFANVASIGIQIGGIGALAPNKKSILAKYGLMALIGGTLASLLSATIIGMILV
jgi:concentrative nucleoside transporter, CNT family